MPDYNGTMTTSGPTLWIDADACPRSALQVTLAVARERKLEVKTVSTWRHEIDLPGHITVDAAPQATDLAILARMAAGDVVITQDYGLAALVLARSGRALTAGGLIFTNDNIDTLLASRADMARLRRSRRPRQGEDHAPRMKSIPARTPDDDRHFLEALKRVLDTTPPAQD